MFGGHVSIVVRGGKYLVGTYLLTSYTGFIYVS
jgi:hypothetical protein